MKEKIPQHLILDLLPLYLVDEVSEETRGLIEEYLKTDPQLSKLAERARRAPSLQEIPTPITKETEMEALEKIKRWTLWRNLLLVTALIFTFDVGIMVVFHLIPIAIYIMVWLAGLFWYVYYHVNKRINE